MSTREERLAQGRFEAKPMRKVLNHGFVALDEVMGNDFTPARCARSSYRKSFDLRLKEDDERLTEYLLRNRHNTPLEQVEMRWYAKMPIFVARQWVRHRTASINEVSLRYVKAANEFYIPELDRCQRQSETNKQGSSSEIVDDPEGCRQIFIDNGNHAYAEYEKLLAMGLSKELARSNLPMGTYTEWWWKNDLHNTLNNFLSLRLDPHAQYEIRVYAEAMLDILKEELPMLIGAWEKIRAGG